MKRVIGLLALLLLVASAIPALAGPVNGPRGYLIGSDQPLTEAQVAALKDAGAQIHFVYRNFGGAAAALTDAALARVSALPFVTSVEEDSIKQLDGVAVAPAGTRTLPGTPYWLDLMDAEKNSTFTGEGVWVAVLDSGFYPNWRDYFPEDRVLSHLGTAFIGMMGNANENQWDVGSDPHGMAVSATIVGYRFTDKPGEGAFGSGYATGAAGTYWVPGVAPGAKIVPVKVCEPVGCFGSAINAGVDYVTSLKRANPNQPIVMNESLGGSRLDALEKKALDAAIAAGVVVVASAGNSGTAGMGFPGAYEPVIGVAAGGWKGQWANYPANTWWLDDVPEGIDSVYIASFSSRAKAGQYLDVAGPGRYMLLPYPCAQLYQDPNMEGTYHRMCSSKASPDSASSAPYQYLYISGTSFSSPAMAGVVALMLEKNPSLSNNDATFGSLYDPKSWRPGSLELLLEGAATRLAPGTATVTGAFGTPQYQSWGADATGKGWVFIDKALKAVPTR